MRRVPIATLKARLSEYLLAVKAGDEVIVTERGKPVARLVPMAEAETRDSRMTDLIRAGLVRPGTGMLPDNFWELPRPSDPEGLVLKALLEERTEGR